MTLPQQEHNSLIATREFLIDLMDSKKIPGVPEKVRLSARALLKHYPGRSKIDELYSGNTFMDSMIGDNSDITEEEKENNNRIYNNNQTWETPGFKWRTEVEFVKAQSK
jgi:hypothetical protein